MHLLFVVIIIFIYDKTKRECLNERFFTSQHWCHGSFPFPLSERRTKPPCFVEWLKESSETKQLAIGIALSYSGVCFTYISKLTSVN